MPYFLILPLFVLGVLLQSAVLGATMLFDRFAPLRPYAWRVLVWSSAGFLAANALLLIPCCVVMMFGDRLGLHDDNPIHQTIGIVAGLGILIGPLLASPLGFGAGVVIAIRRGHRALARSQSEARVACDVTRSDLT